MHLSDYDYRLINLNKLQDHVSEISLHAATCKKAITLALQGQSPIQLKSEIDNYGLASVLCVICCGCHREIQMKTSPTLHINRQSHHFDINVRAVWGAIATGNGHSHLNEFLATVDSPGMHQRTFNKIENDINVWWNDVLQDELKQAVEEEKEIAIAKENFHEGSSIDLRVMHLFDLWMKKSSIIGRVLRETPSPALIFNGHSEYRYFYKYFEYFISRQRVPVNF